MAWLDDVKEICTKELLVPFEGYARKLPNGDCAAYPDPASALGRGLVSAQGLEGLELQKAGHPWTIGYGSTFDLNGKLIRTDAVWTQEKATYVKQQVLNKFLQELLAFSPGLVQEPAGRVAAILSWYYNLGPGNYRVSTFKKRVDAKDWEGAAEECIKWDKAQGKKLRGLTLRRQAEALRIRKNYG